MLDNCPRCDFSIVITNGDFTCGNCSYTLKAWIEDRFQAVASAADISVHEQIADSPALDWDDFDVRR